MRRPHWAEDPHDPEATGKYGTFLDRAAGAEAPLLPSYQHRERERPGTYDGDVEEEEIIFAPSWALREQRTARELQWKSGALALFCVALVVGLAGFSSLSRTGMHVSTLFKRMQMPSGTSTTQSPRPNFVVIMADDIGMYDLGYLNGNVDIYSPVIDDLANAGIKIDRFYTQPLCTPARGAFLTGMYPINTGTEYETVAATSDWGLDPDVPTVADYLQELDYATHLLGKWHLGHAERKYLPTARGFDTYYGYLEAECHYYTHETTDLCNCGDTAFTDFIKADSENLYFVVDNTTRSDKLYANEAEQLIYAHDPEKPLYLQVNFQNAHRPLPSFHMWDYSATEQAFLQTISSPSRQRFAASVMKLDEAVSRVVEALKLTDLWANTYLIFLSDNGGCFQAGGLNVPYRGTKKHLFEGGVRTPSFLSGGLVPSALSGSSYGGLFHVSDWPPTLMALAGQPIDALLDGVSHADTLLQDSSAFPRQQLLLNYQNKSTPATGGVIKGKWKYLLMEANQTWYTVDATEPYTDPEDEGTCTGTESDVGTAYLFDLDADPTETTNLLDDYPEVAEGLEELLYAYLKEGVRSYYTASLDEDDAEKNFISTKYICPWLDDDSTYFLPPRYVSAWSNYSTNAEAVETFDSPTSVTITVTADNFDSPTSVTVTESVTAVAVESRTKRESAERVARRRAWSEEQHRLRPRRNMAI